MPVTADRPEIAQYEPAGHSEQAVAPVDAMKVPGRQVEQLDEEIEDTCKTYDIGLEATKHIN